MRPPKSPFSTALSPTLPILLVLLALPAVALAGPLERVPEDGNLQQALQRVSDGGVVSIAPGVYAATGQGFRIRNPGRSFTVRARGGEVVLDGGGAAPILLVEDVGATSGGFVTFEGVTFQNGRTDDLLRGGAVTLRSARTSFVACHFENNTTAGGASGGAVHLRDASIARFTHSRFTGNRSDLRGGGIYAIDGSTVDVVWSDFERNRVDLPGNNPAAVGGAIYVLDSTLDVVGSRFTANRTAWVGGAIYGFGTWQTPLDEPAAWIRIQDSTFDANLATPSSTPPGPPGGAAIHVEDHVDLDIVGSSFEENVATFGGALSIYRAVVKIEESTFRGNRALPDGATVAAGGAINVGSNDFADASTDFGAINRRSSELTVRGTLFQGRFGTTEIAAQHGGCLFAEGDKTRLAGAGVPQDGDATENRARIRLERVILADCDVQTGTQGVGQGGAVFVNLVDLEMTDSLVFGSEAAGDRAAGGGLIGLGDSKLVVADSTFAENVATDRGGAMVVAGAEIDLSSSNFLRNDVSPDEDEPVQRSTGAALSFGPAEGRDVTGRVAGSLFVANVGLPIFDIDRPEPPFNRVVYSANEIHSTSFDDKIYGNSLVGFGGLSADELNDLTIARSDGSTTVKGADGNAFLPDRPRFGHVLAAPGVLGAAAFPGGEPAATPVLGFAWSGDVATLGGTALMSDAGLRELSSPGPVALRVDGEAAGTEGIGTRDCTAPDVHCLASERFLVEADWRDFTGRRGTASAVFGGADDSGLFFFFDEDNWEMLVKVLNGCGVTQHFWVFAAATTNVETTLRVTDTLTGETTSYFNPLGSAAAAITDTEALAVCDTPSAASAPALPVLPAGVRKLTPRGAAGPCTADDTTLCLDGGRFELEVDWRDFAGNRGDGQVVPFGSENSGLFFFFDANNWEMLVKILDGCGLNDRFWVLAAATTNVEYTLRVRDTSTGDVQEYRNRLGNAAAAIIDVEAFATCP